MGLKQSVSVDWPVAVFDSGLGGLSVLSALCDSLPQEQFVFLADEKHLPYGDKPQHEITERVLALAHSFKNMPAKALVIACNTATAAAADQVRQVFVDWPVVGIEPAVKPAALLTQSGRVGILATSNTLASERFRNLVQRFEGVVQVFAKPCPGLVELIEQNPIELAQVRALLLPHVQSLLAEQVDVIVLGCTHYPFVIEVIRELAGSGVQVIETGAAVARQVAHRLESQGLLNVEAASTGLGLNHPVKFFTTGVPSEFQKKLMAFAPGRWRHAQVQSWAF